MTFFRFYLGLGLASLVFLLAAHVLGWTFTDSQEVKGVPRSVRDNPGAYRSLYLGGK
jgi:hypothetical protein